MDSRTLRRAPGIVLCMLLGLSATRCDDPLDICEPQESRFEFFSRGDCQLTRASFFQGHEWLTYFGNQDLPEEDQFTPEEVHVIAEGNRRVDWPKELLVHLNNGLLAYVSALTEYTERPENQRLHFLLDDSNDSARAASDSRVHVLDLTKRAAAYWGSNRIRALTLIGQANHTIQDSFSPAHARRDTFNVARPWCVVKVKAYIKRASGFDYPDLEYHGGISGDEIGHTTTQDSLYRKGSDCTEPTNATAVDACMDDNARRARRATRDYLAAVHRIVRSGLSGAELDALVESEMTPFSEEHLSLCE